MIPEPHQTLFLASVRTVEEALLCVEAGADVIDCKDPALGALGALPHATVRAIRRAVPGRITVSATIGDCAPDTVLLPAAVREMANAGADIVKIGIFPGGDAAEAIRTLSQLTRQGIRIAGLLLADRNPDLGLIGHMAKARFSGVMLDTAGKSGTTLTDVMSIGELKAFVASARKSGMFAGLAGSLRLPHIRPLLDLKPDLLGFRGALCAAGERRRGLDRVALESVRTAMPRASADAMCEALRGRDEVMS